MFQGRLHRFCLSQKHQTWSNDNFERNISGDGVNLSIG